MSDTQDLDLHRIRITSPFWAQYQALVRDVVVPYQWQALNDRIPDAEPSHAIANFRIAAGLEEPHVATFLEPIEEVVTRRRTFAEDQLDRWNNDMNNKPQRYVETFAITPL